MYVLISNLAHVTKNEHSNLLQCSGRKSPLGRATNYIHSNQDVVSLHRQAINDKITRKKVNINKRLS